MSTTLDDIDLGALPDDLDTREASTPKDSSLIERLRAQRAAAKPLPFDIVIPDWGAETGGIKIIARMRRIALEGKAGRAASVLEQGLLFGKSNDQSQARALAAACDLLIAGLDQFYAKPPDAEDAEPLDDDQPLRFDQRTAELLGLELVEPRARAVVIEIFGGAAGKPRVMQAAKAYYGWLCGVEVDDEGKG